MSVFQTERTGSNPVPRSKFWVRLNGAEATRDPSRTRCGPIVYDGLGHIVLSDKKRDRRPLGLPSFERWIDEASNNV